MFQGIHDSSQISQTDAHRQQHDCVPQHQVTPRIALLWRRKRVSTLTPFTSFLKRFPWCNRMASNCWLPTQTDYHCHSRFLTQFIISLHPAMFPVHLKLCAGFTLAVVRCGSVSPQLWFSHRPMHWSQWSEALDIPQINHISCLRTCWDKIVLGGSSGDRLVLTTLQLGAIFINVPHISSINKYILAWSSEKDILWQQH